MLEKSIVEEHDFQIGFNCKKCGLSTTSLVDAIFSTASLPDKSCYGKLMFSCCNGGTGSAVWDTSNAQWRCSDCGSIQSNDPGYIGGGFKPKDPLFEWGANEKSCTCGSEKTYGPGATHTTWCDKGKK